jgi:hypothetical protein
MMARIQCPKCGSTRATCNWASDSDGAAWTWITWTHNCPVCGHFASIETQWPYDFEDTEHCQLPEHVAADVRRIIEEEEKKHPKSKKAGILRAVERIRGNPELMGRIRRCAEAMVLEAFKELVDHPLAKIILAGIGAWKTPD